MAKQLIKNGPFVGLTTAGENLTNTDDEMRAAFRQIAMAFAQLEKTRLVKKLRGARDRRSIEAGRQIEGRKGYTRGDGAGGSGKLLATRSTLLATSAALAERGYLTASGKPSSASQVKRLIQARDLS